MRIAHLNPLGCRILLGEGLVSPRLRRSRQSSVMCISILGKFQAINQRRAPRMSSNLQSVRALAHCARAAAETARMGGVAEILYDHLITITITAAQRLSSLNLTVTLARIKPTFSLQFGMIRPMEAPHRLSTLLCVPFSEKAIIGSRLSVRDPGCNMTATPGPLNDPLPQHSKALESPPSFRGELIFPQIAPGLTQLAGAMFFFKFVLFQRYAKGWSDHHMYRWIDSASKITRGWGLLECVPLARSVP